jgi:glucose uptake protein GlcU
MQYYTAIGLACAIGSALFNGSFTALFKTKKVADLSIHPMVFQLYVCVGIFLTSWFVVPFLSLNPPILQDEAAGSDLQFSLMGLISGVLAVLAVSSFFCAVDHIGIALAQGVSGGGAMVVSYLWGLLIFGQMPSMLVVSLLGLLLLVLGVLEIAFSEKIGRRFINNTNGSGYQAIPLTADEGNESDTAATVAQTRSDQGRYTRGVLWATAVAFFGGSILAPLHYVPIKKQGLVFLPSFGIGALLLSPMVFYAYLVQVDRVPSLHLSDAAVPGMLSGAIWNVGNLLSIIAIPILTYGVAYPIMQCAILVSGVWGIYVFKEIAECSRIRVFWLSGAILISGGALLTMGQ